MRRMNLMTMEGYECSRAEFSEALAAITFHKQTRTFTVADDNAQADPEIPMIVLDLLGPDDVMICEAEQIMYLRDGLLERIKHLLPAIVRCQ